MEREATGCEIKKDELVIDADMDFSGDKIVAYVGVWFDAAKRFQVHPGDTCDLYAKYDPISQTLHGELCIKGNKDEEQWRSVVFLPSERKTIIGMMEKVARKIRENPYWNHGWRAIPKKGLLLRRKRTL